MNDNGMRPPFTVVHDYLTQKGGAERVAIILARHFGGGELNVLVAELRRTHDDVAGLRVRSTWLSRVPLFREDARTAVALLPFATMLMKLPPAEVTLCSSSGWAHGVRASGKKVVYCHNVPRWLYQTDSYNLGLGFAGRMVGRLLRRPLIAWDQSRARRVDTYIANSAVVAERIQQTYGRSAFVVHPPSVLGPHEPTEAVPGLPVKYYLTVSRPRGYKRTQELAQIFAALPGQVLIVVGTPPPERPSAHAVYLGDVSDGQLRWLYEHCEGLIAVGDEDFGLTPVECFSFGRPVLALRGGGYLETVVDDHSGVFIDRLDEESVRSGIRRLESTRWDRDAIRAHAGEWSIDVFVERIADIVRQTLMADRGMGDRSPSRSRS